MRLCDSYGLDTCVMEPLIAWLIECYKKNVLTENVTELPLSKAGDTEFIEILARKISLREGLGDLLAQGIINAADKSDQGLKKLPANLFLPEPANV